MSATYRLLYLSRATRALEPAEIDALLQDSRARNQAAGLTGALLHYDGRFLQVLEGEPEAVLACFDRIRGDSRHDDILPLIDGATKQRSFAGWAMRYVAPGQPGDRAVVAFLDQLRSHADPDAVHRALQLMQRLAPPAEAARQPV